MAQIAIVATVPSPDEPNVWVYHGGAPLDIVFDDHSLDIPGGTNAQILLSLVPGGSINDTCVFPPLPTNPTPENPGPLSFFLNNIATVPPAWFQSAMLIGDSTLVFTDVNTSQQMAGTFGIKINAIYNQVTSATPIQSPDPTIVNESTNGGFSFQLPARDVFFFQEKRLAEAV